MKTFFSTVAAYFAANKTHIENTFVWVEARNRDTLAVEPVGIWDGDVNVTVTVVDPFTGAAVNRDYLGMGHLLDIPSIVDTSGTNIRTLTITLSGMSPTVLNLVNTLDVRSAPIQIHKGYRDESTMLLLANPQPAWLGFVNGVEINDTANGIENGDASEATVSLPCVSHLRELTNINSKLRSYEAGLERNGDKFFKYADSAGFVRVAWGAVTKSHADHPHSRPKKNQGSGGLQDHS